MNWSLQGNVIELTDKKKDEALGSKKDTWRLKVEIQYVNQKRTREDNKNINKYSKNIKGTLLRMLEKSQNLQLKTFKSNHTNALIKAISWKEDEIYFNHV